MREEIDTKTISLFDPIELAGPSIEELAERARFAIRQLFENSQPVIVAYSSGKDSSVVANLTLVEAKECAAMGFKPMVIITTSDTLVENPEIQEHYRAEHRKMRAFAKAHKFDIRTEIVEPSLLNSMQLKMLTGRGIPSFPGGSSDCSQDLKVVPQRIARRRILKSLKEHGFNEAVTLLGTRFDESERRAMKMKARGDRADTPNRNKDGDLVLSPIAWWSTEDVWEYVGYVNSGLWEGFSDFKEVMRIYADGGGTSCAVVSDSIFEGGAKRKKGGCGQRFGCHSCQLAFDASLSTMVETDPRYAYARPLLKLNTLIRNTRYDWSRRHYVGRTIKEGWIAVEPDTYHPDFLRTLRRAMIQIDFDERQRASMAGERPKFQLLPLEMLIAVDALQNLNGVARPFEVWSDLRDIEDLGIRYEVPEVELVPQQEMPETRFVYVGNDWDAAFGRPVQGLRSSYIEALTEMAPCTAELRELKDGHMVWDIDTDKGFSVDTESASMILDFERERLIEMHDKWQHIPGGITAGYMWYVQYGVLSLDHSQVVFHDEVARRTAWKDRHGLTVGYDAKKLYAEAKRFAEMPDAARKAWATKATDSGAQTDFLSVLDESVESIEAMVG